MKTIIPIILFIAIGLVFSCQKVEILPPPKKQIPCHSQLELIPITDTCMEALLEDPWGLVIDYPGQDNRYRFAAFDPSSYKQFLFFQDELVMGANFCTGEIWTIEDSIRFSLSLPRIPKWSEKGWILLVRWIGDNAYPEERGLYKIKPNGDSLTFLLNENIIYPIWFENGKKIYCINQDTPFDRFILNTDGEEIGTFSFKLVQSSYYAGKFAGLMHPSNWKIVVIEDTIVSKQLWPVNQTAYDFTALDWLNEDEIVWIDSKGIYRGDINTGQHELVKEVCPNIHYSSISAARDGSNRLLLTRRDYLFENGITDSMSTRYNIVLYDLDTGEEFYVKLGEI